MFETDCSRIILLDYTCSFKNMEQWIWKYEPPSLLVVTSWICKKQPWNSKCVSGVHFCIVLLFWNFREKCQSCLQFVFHMFEQKNPTNMLISQLQAAFPAFSGAKNSSCPMTYCENLQFPLAAFMKKQTLSLWKPYCRS